MSLSFREELYKSAVDKLAIGLIIILASFLAEGLIEKNKIINSESIKGTETIVKAVGGYVIKIDDYKYLLESIDNEKTLLEIINIFPKNKSNEKEKLELKIKNLTLQKNALQKKLYKDLKSSDYVIGKELQNHMITHFSYLASLHEAKN